MRTVSIGKANVMRPVFDRLSGRAPNLDEVLAMAIFHLNLTVISRAAGRSAVAAAAYRSCSRLADDRTGKVADYRRKKGHLAGGVVGWEGGAASLWNAVEDAERRKDAKTAREIVLALAPELPLADNAAVVQGFAGYLRRRHGVAVQWDIHAPSSGGDERNIHAHLMLTSRRVEAGRLTVKTRELDWKGGDHIEAWRAEWQRIMNDALARAGSTARIDRRNLARKWLEDDLPGNVPPVPMKHLGPARTAIERRGGCTKAGAFNARLQAERQRMAQRIVTLDRSVERLRDTASRPRHNRMGRHATYVARSAGRLAIWPIEAAAATGLRLVGVRVRRPRLPIRAAGDLALASGHLVIEAVRLVRLGIARHRARRGVPREVWAWWRAVVERQAESMIRQRRAEAFSALARRYPDKAERTKALRAASAVLPQVWRLRLAEADRAAISARLGDAPARLPSLAGPRPTFTLTSVKMTAGQECHGQRRSRQR